MASRNTIKPLNKVYQPKRKEVKYLNKTFPEFRQNLIDFAKVYFPDTYKDFNEASPGMMFIEMASALGDVLSYYIDSQFRENLINYAQEQQNIITIAQALGFRPKPAAAASTLADFFQLVPAKTVDGDYLPDERFYLTIGANSTFVAEEFGNVVFRNTYDLDFSVDDGTRSITVFSVDVNNNPVSYLVKKSAKIEAGEIKTATKTFGDPQKFSKIILPEENVLGILGITDSNGNVWYEVDYLAQDLIMDDIDNNNPDTSTDYSIAPRKILKFRRQPRRFITRYNEDYKLEIQFGSGVIDDTSELIFLDPLKIVSNEFDIRQSSTPINPVDFLSSAGFGLAPANTSLIITYVVGGGIESNAPVNTINKLGQVNVKNDRDVFSSQERDLFDDIVRSLAINNPEPATGGKGADTVEEIRQSALAFFNAQNRLVTAEDYTVRCYTMPPRYGAVSKAYVVTDDQLQAINAARLADVVTSEGSVVSTNTINPALVEDSPKSTQINLYVLGYNSSKQLRTLNSQTKINLKQYLSQYKMLTEKINIIDAFIVNIGVNFRIVIYKNYNVSAVLAEAIDSVKTFFEVDRWDINQPIIMNDLYLQIANVEGVKSVIDLEVVNKYAYQDGGDYEEYRYDISGNALDISSGVIYPSLDPMIFELRYPDTDIVASAIQ